MRNYSKLKNIVFVFCFLMQLSATADTSYVADGHDEQFIAQSETDLFGEGSKQLSEINMLLPIHTCKECRRAYQKVVAYHGCFDWWISHPNLIEMQPIASKSHPECTNVVRISNL